MLVLYFLLHFFYSLSRFTSRLDMETRGDVQIPLLELPPLNDLSGSRLPTRMEVFRHFWHLRKENLSHYGIRFRLFKNWHGLPIICLFQMPRPNAWLREPLILLIMVHVVKKTFKLFCKLLVHQFKGFRLVSQKRHWPKRMVIRSRLSVQKSLIGLLLHCF